MKTVTGTKKHEEQIQMINEVKQNRRPTSLKQAGMARWMCSVALLVALVAAPHIHAAQSTTGVIGWIGRTAAGFLAGKVLEAGWNKMQNIQMFETTSYQLVPTQHRAHLRITTKDNERIHHKEYFREALAGYQYVTWASTDGVTDFLHREPFQVVPGSMDIRCTVRSPDGAPMTWTKVGDVETKLVIVHKVLAKGHWRGLDAPPCVVKLEGSRYDRCEKREGPFMMIDRVHAKRNGEVPYGLRERQIEIVAYNVSSSS